MTKWIKGPYLMARSDGIVERTGYIRGALAMELADRVWTLTHTHSGHRICRIKARKPEAFTIADLVHDLTLWDAFTGPESYQNVEPDLPAKLHRLAAMMEGKIILGQHAISPDMAAEIARRMA